MANVEARPRVNLEIDLIVFRTCFEHGLKQFHTQLKRRFVYSILAEAAIFRLLRKLILYARCYDGLKSRYLFKRSHFLWSL